jgi:hypothetical protein
MSMRSQVARLFCFSIISPAALTRPCCCCYYGVLLGGWLSRGLWRCASSGSLRIARNAFPGIGLLAKEQRRRVAASGKAGTIR